MIDAYIDLKMGEVNRGRVEVSPVEYDMYFSL
jgi:glutamine synthetase